MRTTITVIVIIPFLAMCAFASETGSRPTNDPAKNVLDGLLHKYSAVPATPGDNGAGTGSTNSPRPPDPIDVARHASIEAGYNLDAAASNDGIANIAYVRRVYWWQFFSTIVIFALVVGVVIVGVRMSIDNFKTADAAAKNQAKSRQAREELTNRIVKLLEGEREISAPMARIVKTLFEGEGSTLSTEFEASLSRVKMSSSLVGVLVLGLSLAFFLVYAVVVYPIHYTSQDKPEAATNIGVNVTRAHDNE